jgi:hypothetical protein
MITNETELEVTRRQLANVEAAIESLRKQLLPAHETNFNLYARPWLDIQQEMQSAIDTYLRSRTPSPNGAPATSKPSDSPSLERT